MTINFNSDWLSARFVPCLPTNSHDLFPNNFCVAFSCMIQSSVLEVTEASAASTLSFGWRSWITQALCNLVFLSGSWIKEGRRRFARSFAELNSIDSYSLSHKAEDFHKLSWSVSFHDVKYLRVERHDRNILHFVFIAFSSSTTFDPSVHIYYNYHCGCRGSHNYYWAWNNLNWAWFYCAGGRYNSHGARINIYEFMTTLSEPG